jgi:hypothetical protein
MNDIPAVIASPRRRKLTVPLTGAEYAALSALAGFSTCKSASSFLRYLAQKAITAANNTHPADDRERPGGAPDVNGNDLNRRLAQLEYRNASFEATLARIGNATADNPAHLREIDALVRATLFQAIAASYLGIEIWRALAPASKLPEHTLPPEMLADIQAATRRITAEAERDARG